MAGADREGGQVPRITLVVPAADAGNVPCMESARAQDPRVEIVVVAGPSPSANRNAGIARARTEFVAFTNAHAVLAPGWSRAVLDFFQTHPAADAVGGPQFNHPGDPPLARLTGHALNSRFGGATIRYRYLAGRLRLDADETHVTSANLICRRRVVEAVKFDESVYPGEDPKFVCDAMRAGFRVAYSPEIVVFNHRRQTVGPLFRQVANYGRTRAETGWRRLMGTPLFFVPGLFVLYLAALPLLAWVAGPMALGPLGVYLALACVFAVREAVREKSAWLALALAPVFPILHVSYGLGFLAGLAGLGGTLRR